jgi:hypothetical protein
MPEVSTELPSASSLSGSSNLSESIQPCQELDLYSMLLQYSTGSEVLDLIWAIQLQDSGVVTRMPRPYLDTVILFLTWNILVILSYDHLKCFTQHMFTLTDSEKARRNPSNHLTLSSIQIPDEKNQKGLITPSALSIRLQFYPI